MDTSKYQQMFIDESKTSLGTLVEALQKIKSEHSTELVAEIRRGFHSLKSGCAAMGHESESQLSKEMEMLITPFDEEKTELSPELIQQLADAANSLVESMQKIENSLP